MLAALILGVTLPCSGLVAVAPAKVFRITGVAVSSGDGSPIPYCRLTATEVREVADGGGRGGRGGFGPGGFSGGGGPMILAGIAGFVGHEGDLTDDGVGRGGGQRRGGPAEPENSTTADAQGHFSLIVPRAGAWRLVGMARGFRSQSYEQHDTFYSQIVLTDAVPVYSLTFRMARDSVISGVIYDEAGEAVRQARVSAELVPVRVEGQPRLPSRQAGGSATDDRGHYEISGLAPGAYRVKVQGSPWYSPMAVGGGIVRLGANATPAQQSDLGASLDPSLDMVYAITWFPGADSEDAAETIELTGGDEREADFHLNAVSAIHLRVPRPEVAAVTAPDGRPRPQGAAMVSRVSADGSINPMMSIGGNGAGDLDFGGLTPGIYEVRMPGPDGQPGGGDVKQIEVQGGSRVVTLDGARPLTKVTIKVDGLPDDSFPFVEFVDVETGRRIVAQEGRGGRGGGRGRRGDDDNAGPEAAALQDPPDRTLTAMLPPHRYAVSVGGNSGVYLSGMSATDAKVVGNTVEIAGGTPSLTLEVASGHGDLAGFVRQDAAKPGSSPTEGAMVLLVPITLGQPGDNSVVERAQSNTDGSFAFRAVQPGRYILVAIEHGWGVQWTNPQTLANYLAHGVPIELKAGGKMKEEIGAVLP